MDRVLDYALWLTVRELEPYWMPAFKEGKLTFGGDPKKLAFALNAVGTQDAVKPVLELIKMSQPDRRHGLFLLLARIGGPEELIKVVQFAAFDASPPKQAYVEPTAVGRELLEMPLFLNAGHYVNVPLEATYRAAYEGVPRKWREVLDK